MFRSKDELGRAVTSGEEAKQCRAGILPASVFSRHGTHEISVDRFGNAAVSMYIDSGRAVALTRGPTRRFHGWLVLNDRDIASLGLTSQPDPLQGNPNHWNIMLPPSVDTDDDEHDRWAARLARYSNWVRRP